MKRPNVFLSLGLVFCLMGSPLPAIAWDADTEYTLGQDAYRLGQYEEALAHYRAALATDPQREDALLAIGRVYLTTGQTADAEKIYLDLLSRRPNHAAALGELGLASLDQRAYGKAENYLKQALTQTLTQDQTKTFRYRLGMAYFRQEKYAEARGQWQQVKEMDLGFRDVAEQLGQLDRLEGEQKFRLSQHKRASGKNDEALRLLEEAIKLDPNNVTYAQALVNGQVTRLARRGL